MGSYDFSPTMKAALAYMRAHDCKMVRYPGGFWARQEWGGRGEPFFGASTMNALEFRGAIKWTKHQERSGGSGTFPVEAEISERS